MATAMSRGGPLATGEAKRMLYRGLGRDADAHMRDHLETMSRLFASEDHREGVASFLEKREPIWRGR